MVRNALGFYHNVGMTAAFTIPLPSASPLLPIIYASLAAVMYSHPILSSIPVDELSNAAFAPMPSISLPEVVHHRFRSFPSNLDATFIDNELDTELQVQHNTGFPASLPRWRLLVLQDPLPAKDGISFTASFIFHHALGDGLSGLAFLRPFAYALRSQPDVLQSTTISTSMISLLPPLESIHCDPPVPPAALSPPPNCVSVSSSPQGGLWAGSNPSITLPLTSRFRSFTLTPYNTRVFRSRCRSESTTVTAVLQTILAFSIFNAIPSEYDRLQGSCSLSLRPFLRTSIPENGMGTFVAGCAKTYLRENITLENSGGQKAGTAMARLWNEARRTRDAIQAGLKRESEKLNNKLPGQPQDTAAHLQGLVGQQRVASFDVNNLGVFNLPRHSTEVHVGRVVFSASASVVGAALKMNIVTGLEEDMTIGFVWQKEVVLDEVVEKIIGGVQAMVEELGDGQGSKGKEDCTFLNLNSISHD